MIKLQKQVRRLYKQNGLVIGKKGGSWPDAGVKARRASSMKEEVRVLDAVMFGSGDLEMIGNHIGQTLRAVVGAAVEFGIDVEPILDMLHHSSTSRIVAVEKRRKK